jgi:hypothetical protein
MPSDKFLNIDFYRVKVEDKEDRTFLQLLELVQAMPDDEGRAQNRTDDAIRLQSIKKSASAWRGEMLRIRMNEAPVKAKRSGETKAIDFDEDEGLGEETAFLFNVATSILVMQRNRSGVSGSALAKYFKVLGKVKAITFECILKEDALNRIAKMQNINTFEVHFAGVQNGQSLKGKGHSAKAMYTMLDEFQAPNATIRLSAGRKQGTLQNVVNAVADLFGNQADAHPAEVKRVIVIGSEGDGEEKTLIDLLQDRLSELVIVEVKDGERITSAQRFKALNTAWDRNQSYLENNYANPGE